TADDGVRGGLNIADLLRVHHEGLSVQSCEADHGDAPRSQKEATSLIAVGGSPGAFPISVLSRSLLSSRVQQILDELIARGDNLTGGREPGGGDDHVDEF